MHCSKLAVVAVACIAMVGAKSPPLAPLVVGPDQIVTATVGGQPVRLRMMASGPRTLFLNPALVARLSIKPGMFGGYGGVGPVKVRFNSAVIRYGVNTTETKRRVLWADRDFAPGVDGGIGPGGVAHPIVRFILREPSPREVTFTLPLFGTSAGYGALETKMIINGEAIGIGFDLTRDATLATAAAAAALSATNGAQLSGEARQEDIRMGVARPVRTLSLQAPLLIGMLQLREISARVSDNSDGNAIADKDVDASEIVVTAKGAKSKPHYSILIGREALAHCSSLTFDKLAKLIRLSCIPSR